MDCAIRIGDFDRWGERQGCEVIAYAGPIAFVSRNDFPSVKRILEEYALVTTAAWVDWTLKRNANTGPTSHRLNP